MEGFHFSHIFLSRCLADKKKGCFSISEHIFFLDEVVQKMAFSFSDIAAGFLFSMDVHEDPLRRVWYEHPEKLIWTKMSWSKMSFSNPIVSRVW